MGLPTWLTWKLCLIPHVEERMVDRGFTEVDLRRMLAKPRSCRRSFLQGRWIVEAVHRHRSWEVIVEPDEDQQVLVVITAYPLTTWR
jgi:hypothetical protein